MGQACRHNAGMDEPELVPLEAVAVVQRFTRLVWADRNLRGAWVLVDELLRQCWTQQWLYPVLDRLAGEGYDSDDVVAAFMRPIPEHPLWEAFEQSQLRNLLSWGDLDKWSIPTHRRQVNGVDLVVLVPTSPPGGVIPPGGFVEGLTVMTRPTTQGWRVLNLSSDHVIPEPGWPPRLM
jgi:hypothetical protein